jgi:hypothetical protein
MCSYKLVTVSFDVWGLQSRVESFVHKVSVMSFVSSLCMLFWDTPGSLYSSVGFVFVQGIRDILLVGHRQAFSWIDEWWGKL